MNSLIETGNLPPQKIDLKFYGRAGEYFRIWIVNLALTVVTLGIYSAWAKVRTKKYFYGNTEAAGSRFDYHGDPVRILIGRLVVGGLFIGYSVGSRVSPSLSLLFLLLFALVLPWVVVRALIFALSNTSYRNIRFGFRQDYRGSYATYLKAGAVWIFTLGLGIPYAAYLHTDFRLNRIRFGNQYLTFKARVIDFFKYYYSMIGMIVIAGLCMGMILAAFGKSSFSMILAGISLYTGIILATASMRANLINLVGNNVQLGPVRFQSRLDTGDVMWIYISNLVMCVLTLGLAIPWAIVRALKYRIERTSIVALEGALEQMNTDAAAVGANAGADAAADFWDIDLGF